MNGFCSVGQVQRYPCKSSRKTPPKIPSKRLDGAPQRRSESITLALADGRSYRHEWRPLDGVAVRSPGDPPTLETEKWAAEWALPIASTVSSGAGAMAAAVIDARSRPDDPPVSRQGTAHPLWGTGQAHRGLGVGHRQRLQTRLAAHS